MQTLTTAGPALLGLALIIAMLLVVVVVMLVRAASVRTRARKGDGGDSAMLSMALQEAVNKLKAQERQMAARAEASERLAGQIVEGLTSGMVVVDRDGAVQTMNPAARRILGLDADVGAGLVSDVLRRVPALADVIGEALRTTAPIVRRTVTLEGGGHGRLTWVSPYRTSPAPAARCRRSSACSPTSQPSSNSRNACG